MHVLFIVLFFCVFSLPTGYLLNISISIDINVSMIAVSSMSMMMHYN